MFAPSTNEGEFKPDGNEWWRQQVRNYYTYYDKVDPRLSETEDASVGVDPRVGLTGFFGKKLSPVERILACYKYYLGIQDNKDYHYALQGESLANGQVAAPLPTPWIKGQKITSLVDFMLGKFLDIIDNIDPSVRTTSKAASNRKTKLLEKMLLKFEAPELFADMEAYGVGFDPMSNSEAQLETPEQVYRFMEKDYKEHAEEIGVRLTEDILNRNDLANLYRRAALFLIMGGAIGIENYVHNKKSMQRMVEPHKLIMDTTGDDDMHSRDRFAGYVDYISREELLKYPSLTNEEREEIQKLTSSNYTDTLGISGTNRWATWDSENPVFAKVTMYWRCLKDMKYAKTKDKYDNTHYEKKRKGAGEYATETVHKAVLIGNKYLVEFGEDTNIVRATNNKGDVELPLRVYTPNIILGRTRSIIERLQSHQDRVDYLTAKLTRMIDNAIGKVYIINRHKLGTSTAPEVLDDFKRMGFHIGDGNADGEENNPEKRDRMVETIDMTMDPNVSQLVNLRNEEQRIMEEIVNVPKIALGQQTGYVGAKTHAGTIAQSATGTAHIYKGFISFIEKQLRHALNQYKLAALSEGEDEVPLMGTSGVYFLKLIKDIQFEEMNVYIKIRDFIDDQARERLLSNAQFAMQNQMIDMLDYLAIEKSRTYSELQNELEYSLKRRKRDAEKQQQMMMMMQQAQAEQQMQGKREIEQMKDEGETYRAGLKVGAQDLENPQ